MLSRFRLDRDSLRTVYLVARRELVTRGRSRVFMIGTLVLLAVVPGYILLQGAINRPPAAAKVGFAGPAQVLAAPFQATASALKVAVSVSTVTAADGRTEIQNGKLDVLVQGDPGRPTVTVKDKANPTVNTALDATVKQRALAEALAAKGVSPGDVAARVAAAGISVEMLNPDAAKQAQEAVAGIFVAAILYVALLLYGQIVAQGVIEEKSNRVVEILLATVRPAQLLFGKVVGIGLLGLGQLALVGAAAVVAGTVSASLDIPAISAGAVAASLLWFVLGFLMYALLYAAGGSLVSRQEDVASVTMPITVLVVGSYLAFFWVVAHPDSPVSALLSVLPPFAPILMPARLAAGQAGAPEFLLAVLLAAATIAGLTWLAGRIYANSVLRTGSRVSFREALRAGRA